MGFNSGFKGLIPLCNIYLFVVHLSFRSCDPYVIRHFFLSICPSFPTLNDLSTKPCLMDSRSNDPPYSVFSILLSRSRSWILMFTSVVCSGTLDLCSFIYVNRPSPTPIRNNAVLHNYVEAGKMQRFFFLF